MRKETLVHILPGSLIRHKAEGSQCTAHSTVIDALMSPRPYKEPWQLEEAIAEIQRGAGSQFDPVCVAAALQSREAFCAIHRQYRDPVIT